MLGQVETRALVIVHVCRSVIVVVLVGLVDGESSALVVVPQRANAMLKIDCEEGAGGR